MSKHFSYIVVSALLTACPAGLFATMARADDMRTEVHLGSPDWDAILHKAEKNITFGVSLHGPSPYARNNSTPFTPASNSKLYTTMAALEKLGAAASFITSLEWTDLDPTGREVTGVTLRGSGDPSPGLDDLGETLTSRVALYADALEQSGVRVIRGNVSLVAADPRWDSLRYPEGWTEGDRVSCDGSLAQAFNLALNCATYVVTGAKHGHWAEAGVTIPVKLRIRAGRATRLDVEAPGERGDVSRSFVISGTLGPSGAPVSFRLPVHDTRAWTANLFKRELKRRGIRLLPAKTGLITGNTHRLDFASPTLARILKPFLKHSQNVVGDAIFKILGSRFGAPGNDLVKAGQDVLRELAQNLGARAAAAEGLAPQPGFFSEDVELFDGSGMSHASHVTTDALMALLLDLRARPDFAAVWDALPIAGVDGTLAYRMRKTPAQGVLRAKTGTVNGAYNLSGYVPRLSADGKIQEYVPFVILTRTTSKYERLAHRTEDRIGAELARALNSANSQWPVP